MASTIVGSMTAALLLLAARTNVGDWTFGRFTIPCRPLLYAAFFLLFVVTVYRLVAATETSIPGVADDRAFRSLRPYIAAFAAGTIVRIAEPSLFRTVGNDFDRFGDLRSGRIVVALLSSLGVWRHLP